MAKLYRRVSGVPYRRVTRRRIAALGVFFLACVARSPDAEAQGYAATEASEALIAKQVARLTSGKAEQQRQARRSLAGLDIGALPMLLELRGHASPAVRRWAKQGVEMLEMQDPAVATALADPHLVAKVIRAYADPLDFEARPVITPFLSDSRMEVREAARWAIGRFGENAIWQLRKAYLEATGKHAVSSWKADRVARELYAVVDRPSVEQAEALLAQGLSAIVSGNLETMKRCFDRALTIHPVLERRPEMAPGYAAYGEAQLEKGHLRAAASAFSRAIRLGPEDARVRAWQSRLALIRSDQRLQGGVVDLEGYREALALDPDNARAASALDRLGGAWLQRHLAKKQWARIGSVVLLGVFALLLLLGTRFKKPLRRTA